MRVSMNLPELGVGLTWLSGLESLIEANSDCVDVLEVEPQAFWRRHHEGAPLVESHPLGNLRQLPQAKLIHSVGLPVGGTLAPDATQVEMLRTITQHLDVP